MRHTLSVPGTQAEWLHDLLDRDLTFYREEYLPDGHGPDGESLEMLTERIDHWEKWLIQLKGDGGAKLSGRGRFLVCIIERALEVVADDVEAACGTWRKDSIDVDETKQAALRLDWLADGLASVRASVKVSNADELARIGDALALAESN